MSARTVIEAERIAKAALKAGEKEFGGGLLVGATRYALVVIVHQLGEDMGGLAINVATNIPNNPDGVERIALEGVRVVRGQRKPQ